MWFSTSMYNPVCISQCSYFQYFVKSVFLCVLFTRYNAKNCFLLMLKCKQTSRVYNSGAVSLNNKTIAIFLFWICLQTTSEMWQNILGSKPNFVASTSSFSFHPERLEKRLLVSLTLLHYGTTPASSRSASERNVTGGLLLISLLVRFRLTHRFFQLWVEAHSNARHIPASRGSSFISLHRCVLMCLCLYLHSSNWMSVCVSLICHGVFTVIVLYD